MHTARTTALRDIPRDERRKAIAEHSMYVLCSATVTTTLLLMSSFGTTDLGGFSVAMPVMIASACSVCVGIINAYITYVIASMSSYEDMWLSVHPPRDTESQDDRTAESLLVRA